MTHPSSNSTRPRTIAAQALWAAALLTGSSLGQGIGGGAKFEDAATLINQKLGANIARDASFKDENGADVKIADYFTGERPVILNLQYYRCPSLCGPLVNGFIDALKAVPMTAGKEFDVLTISFDHREGPQLAIDKKASLLAAFDALPAKQQGGESNWHFLTSDQANIRKLTESVGYGFRWNETKNDFDHRATIIFISPNGKITRYLNGTFFDPSTFRLAIVEASDGKVGTALDRFLLSCYGYDPRTGTYSRIGPVVMTTGAALTVGFLFTLLFVLWRKDRRRQAVSATAS